LAKKTPTEVKANRIVFSDARESSNAELSGRTGRRTRTNGQTDRQTDRTVYSDKHINPPAIRAVSYNCCQYDCLMQAEFLVGN